MGLSQGHKKDSHRSELERAAGLAADKREDEAYEVFASLLNSNFDDAHALYGLARIYLQGEHYGLAYNLYRLCAGFKNLGTGPWNGMGLCHAETWDLDAAMSLFKRALSLDPNDKHALGNMSLMHVDRKSVV